METFRDDLSKRDKSNFETCSKKASQAKDHEETKLINKKSEDANKLNFDTGPWWRMADGQELASLVSQRSLNLMENCDLPQPQSSRFGGGHAGNFPLSLHLNACATTNSNKQGSCTSSLPEAHITESNPSKAELLEALCRCQTRARKAERLANESYAEKEQILKLFFQQASHLFAYKQWLQLLQLENLHFQNKIDVTGNKNGDDSDQQNYIQFPTNLPSVDREISKVRKIKKNPARGKRSRKVGACAYVSKLGVGFATAFGLIGAGLLLGWTVGWIFPLY